MFSSPAHEHFGHFAIVVVEEEALAGVEGGNTSHIVLGQREVEDVEVLRHTLLVS